MEQGPACPDDRRARTFSPLGMRAPNVTALTVEAASGADAAWRLPRNTVLKFDQRCFRCTQRWNRIALPTNDCAAVTCTVKRCSALRLNVTIARVETGTRALVTAFAPPPNRT